MSNVDPEYFYKTTPTYGFKVVSRSLSFRLKLWVQGIISAIKSFPPRDTTELFINEDK